MRMIIDIAVSKHPYIYVHFQLLQALKKFRLMVKRRLLLRNKEELSTCIDTRKQQLEELYQYEYTERYTPALSRVRKMLQQTNATGNSNNSSANQSS
jgi:hypothetical protein